MTKVSIVCAYNTEVEMTINFLDTMLFTTRGDGFDKEMILVNGGCETDIVHSFVNKFIRLDKNYGFCKVLNTGLKEVSKDSDYILFIGNDSFPTEPNWLPKLIEVHNKYNAIITCPENDRPGTIAYNHLYTSIEEEINRMNMYPSIVWLFKRELLDTIGYLDEDYVNTGMYADNDYCDRIRRVYGNNRIILAKGILLRHLLSRESGKRPTLNADMTSNCQLYQRKVRDRDLKSV